MIARKRTRNVVNRLAREPNLLKLYGDIIRDQETRGFIEKVENPDDEKSSRVHYIPHHPVKKDSSTTPIRIVYDCSCRQNSETPSLNDCLSSSPPQLNRLTDILSRFRFGRYAFTTDMEKAFLQIGLDERDRDATRFFWLSNPSNPKSELETYRFKVILFGATCSPFILNATILKHLSLHPSITSEIIKRDLYVDNVLTSVDSEETAVRFYKESRELLKPVGFNLRTWKSNSELLNERATQENILDTDTDTKILGMRWNAKSDTLTFAQQKEVNIDNSQTTNREILRQSSSIYDRLGIIGPVTIRAKVLMQRLWKNGFEWDEVLPSDIIDSWCDIRDDIQEVTKNVKMSRHYFDGEIESENGQDKTVTLHVFADASQKAYGASAYLCKGNICSLVLAKNRVAPLKKITLPKLELMAAVIGTRIPVQLRQNLEIDRTVFWSDSQIVLYWISSTKPINKFVNNRVSEIKESTNDCEWKYVPTESNPADIQTRGISASQFRESTLWMEGPTWISDETTWPKWTPQLKQETTLLTTTDDYGHDETQDSNLGETTGISRIIDIKRFSTLNKLVRVTCYVLKFVKHCRIRRAYNFRRNRTHGLEIITDEEYQRSLGLWIKSVQNETFEREIDQIRTNSRNKELPMLRQLRLFIDDDDIVRCAGRIHNSTLDENTKFPILLPKKHELTDLIVWDAHLKMLHSGTGQTITQIRQS